MRYGRKRLHSAEHRAAERLAQKQKFLAGVGQYGYSRSDFNAIAVGRQARETTHFFATTY